MAGYVSGEKICSGYFYLHELLSEKRQALSGKHSERPQQNAFGFEVFPPEGEIYPDQLKRSRLIQLRIGLQNGGRTGAIFIGFAHCSLGKQTSRKNIKKSLNRKLS